VALHTQPSPKGFVRIAGGFQPPDAHLMHPQDERERKVLRSQASNHSS
jgi:hypothetical protein